MADKVTIGLWFKDLRIKAGYRTQSELATDMRGFDRSTIGKIESGQQYPTVPFMIEFASITDIPINDLVRGNKYGYDAEIRVEEEEASYEETLSEEDVNSLIDKLATRHPQSMELFNKLKTLISAKDTQIIRLLEEKDKIYERLIKMGILPKN